MQMKKKLTIGILAHVDAGKTTLSEALLYLSGKIRKVPFSSRFGKIDSAAAQWYDEQNGKAGGKAQTAKS